MKILFTGGGTAGHIFPIIAIVREIKKIYPKKDLEIFYLGPKDEFGQLSLSQEGIQVRTIFAGKIRRYLRLKNIFLNIFDIFFKTPIGFVQSFFWIFFLAPDIIFSKGGYGSIPAVLSGWILGTRTFLHESDVVPGLANRLASRFALEIFVSFPVQETEYFPRDKMICVGNPIRKRLFGGSKTKAQELFKISGEKPVILVLGGSQGAQRINDMLLLILPEILAKFELLHQCGKRNFKNVEAEAKVVINKELEKHYHLFPFFKETELKLAYQVADIIISRAGAGSIFEIAAIGKPSILIPLPESAQNHQVKNAYVYNNCGATMVLEETNGLSPHFFLERLQYLISRPRRLEQMASEARRFARPQAASIIANYIIEYLTS